MKRFSSAIDKEIILSILENIKETNYIGTINAEWDFGEYIDFGLDKELIERTPTGNFQLTVKGFELLDSKIDWDRL
jgi:hypothetical protein